MFRRPGYVSCCVGVLLFLVSVSPARAQVESGLRSRPQITQDIDERTQSRLRHNTHPEAKPENDRGRVEDDFRMDHLLLQLRRPPEQEEALQRFIDELQTEGSPNFHRWITAKQFGETFGLATQDLDKITDWLESHGFRVNVVYPSGMVIDFSGTARQVERAFHTEIHSLEVRGEKHVSNMADPQIPAALAPAVVGIVSLNDFRPKSLHQMRKVGANYTFPSSFGNAYAMVPADLATIYNLNPLFKGGYAGQGQTIVVI